MKDKEDRGNRLVTSRMPPVGDLARNPGMCPDWVLNWQLFDSQADAQSSEPYQAGLSFFQMSVSQSSGSFLKCMGQFSTEYLREVLCQFLQFFLTASVTSPVF